MKTEEEGSLTIFSALSLLLILSFLLALLEGARVSGLQMMDTLAADTGMDCVAAEYQTVLWDKYHLLYLDGAYGWDQFDENKVSSRVMDYVAGNLSETGENSVFRTKLCEASGICIYEEASAGGCCKENVSAISGWKKGGGRWKNRI